MTDRTAAIRLIAVGDLQLGDSATCVGFGFRSRVTDRALRSALERLVSVIGRSDVGFANLETPLSDLGLDSRRRQSRQLRGAPSYAQVLRCGGFSVVNVANNHALEHGPEVFRDSVSRVEATGVTICGRRGSAGWSSEPAVKIVRDLRIGFLGYSLRPSQAAVDVRPHAEATVEQIGSDVHRLRSRTDCVIVSLHWGEEFAQIPSASEVAMAHAIVDAGATAILGHHPHVVRPVERYRDAVIAYSLGNFMGDMVWYPPHRQGLVLDCELTARGVEGVRAYRARVDASYLPVVDPGSEVQVMGSVTGLPEVEYVRLARSTVQAQRRALYLYTLRNAWRFSPGVLLELVATTLRGRATRLFAGHRDEIWG